MLDEIRMFLGFDQREAAGTYVCLQSLRERAKVPVCVKFLSGAQRDGTNAFTYERFEILERCGWSGWALWVDGADMLFRSCPGELWALADPRFALQVVPHDYRTKHPRKYVGTAMEADNRDYPRKNQSSVMLINCGHRAHLINRERISQAIEECDGAFLHRFGWLQAAEIGALPREWNWLDEYGENANAKLVHWTTGIPGFNHYRNAPHAEEWRATLGRMLDGLQTHTIQEG